MTDTQNPTPLDGSENPSSEREKTVAELEVEARERAQAQRKESAPVEDVKPDQPEVNSLKKRGKNRLMTLGILLLAALIVLAWMGDWAYNHFMSAPAPKAEQAKTAPDDVSYGRKRQGMGMAENPIPQQTFLVPPLRPSHLTSLWHWRRWPARKAAAKPPQFRARLNAVPQSTAYLPRPRSLIHPAR